MNIFGLLPYAAGILLWLGFVRRGGGEWWLAALQATTAIAVAMVVAAEALSLFGALTPLAILLFWAAAVVVAALWLRATPRPWPPNPLAQPPVPIVRVALALAALWAVALGAVAIVAAPNNWDSMTYHLPRVMHWLERASLGHFPARDTRLLELAPGHELALLHFLALTGGDLWLNLVQWIAWLGVGVAASLIVREWGGSRVSQAAAGLFACSVPMAVLQATTTQNDLTVSMWIMISVLAMERLVARAGARWLPGALLAGAAIGMAVLTKGTAYISLAPWIIWCAWRLVRSQPAGWMRCAAVIVGLVAALNAGHASRNFELYGNAMGSGRLKVENARFGVDVTLSNLARNAALHAGLWNEYSINSVVPFVSSVLRDFGIDPNDPDTTWRGAKFTAPPIVPDEDFMGNPLHAALIACALVLAFLPAMRRQRRWAALLLAGVLLFCTLLRWQPWNSRLHLPFFMLGAPLIAIAFENISAAAAPARGRVGLLAAIMALLASAPWMLMSETHPMLGPNSVFVVPRDSQYFARNPDDAALYNNVVAAIWRAAPQEVGLMVGGNRPEYPIWALLGANRPRMRQVFVPNESAGLSLPGEDACPLHLLILGDPRYEPLLPAVRCTIIAGRPPLLFVRLARRIPSLAQGVMPRPAP